MFENRRSKRIEEQRYDLKSPKEPGRNKRNENGAMLELLRVIFKFTVGDTSMPR